MATLDTDSINRFKVKLVEFNINRSVILDVTPDITENQSVSYKSYDPVHMPGTIYVFGSSASRSFSLSNVRLVCRSANDATRNLYIINTLRSWTKPRFGSGSSTIGNEQRSRRVAINAADEKNRSALQSSFDIQKNEGRISESEIYGSELLGAPPAVLQFSAYSDPNVGTNNTLKGIIDRVPVVITNLSFPFTSEVDYILTAKGEKELSFIPAGIPVPAVTIVDINLSETHSPSEYAKFSLDDYRQGKLLGF